MQHWRKPLVVQCFDSVCPQTAIKVWRWFGAPSSICDLLADFYSEQRRWFAWQGSYHPHPVFAQRGLLQGCPASPALLNALMTVWVRFVKRQGTKDFFGYLFGRSHHVETRLSKF